MPFIGNILKYKSLSIVGLEKNTGKTECLNYVIRRLKDSGKTIALTSIGMDGETIDQVTDTHKPEIVLYNNMIFMTSEKHYRQKQLVSEILNVSDKQTALGRLVTARAMSTGTVLFSGPSDTTWLKKEIANMQSYQVDTTIVDGAISRLSLSSPAVTQCMILATGAALSANISTIAQKTRFVYTLISLEAFKTPWADQLMCNENGVFALPENDQPINLEIPSIFMLEKFKEQLMAYGNTIYVAGAVGDKLLNYLRIQKQISEITLVVRDFTKLFVTSEAYLAFIKRGGKIKVLLRPELLAVCANPVSPLGFRLDSAKLCEALQHSLDVPVYDIKKI